MYGQAHRGATAEGSVFWVGECGSKTHDFQMFPLSLQVVACIEAIICGFLCKGRNASGD